MHYLWKNLIRHRDFGHLDKEKCPWKKCLEHKMDANGNNKIWKCKNYSQRMFFGCGQSNGELGALHIKTCFGRFFPRIVAKETKTGKSEQCSHHCHFHHWPQTTKHPSTRNISSTKTLINGPKDRSYFSARCACIKGTNIQ